MLYQFSKYLSIQSSWQLRLAITCTKCRHFHILKNVLCGMCKTYGWILAEQYSAHNPPNYDMQLIGFYKGPLGLFAYIVVERVLCPILCLCRGDVSLAGEVPMLLNNICGVSDGHLCLSELISNVLSQLLAKFHEVGRFKPSRIILNFFLLINKHINNEFDPCNSLTLSRYFLVLYWTV